MLSVPHDKFEVSVPYNLPAHRCQQISFKYQQKLFWRIGAIRLFWTLEHSILKISEIPLLHTCQLDLALSFILSKHIINKLASCANHKMLPTVILSLLALSSSCSHHSHNLTEHDVLVVMNLQNDYMESMLVNHDTISEYPIPDSQIIEVDGRNVTRPGVLAINHTTEIIEPINAMMRYFEERGAPVILSMNWRPRNHCSFCRNGTEPTDTTCGPFGPKSHGLFNATNACHDRLSRQLLRRHMLLQWPDNSVRNKYGSRFSPYLEVNQEATVVKKSFFHHFDSLSVWNAAITNASYPFWNATEEGEDLITQPSFRSFTYHNKIKRIFVVGVPLDYDVFFSCADAIAHDLDNVVLISPLTRGMHTHSSDMARHKLKKMGVTMIPSNITKMDDVLDVLCKMGEPDARVNGEESSSDVAHEDSEINFESTTSEAEFEDIIGLQDGDDGDDYDYSFGHHSRLKYILIGSLGAAFAVPAIAYGAWKLTRGPARRGSSYDAMI
jgi:nicotinamidase-related amidase